jgi:hypothetical protein
MMSAAPLEQHSLIIVDKIRSVWWKLSRHSARPLHNNPQQRLNDKVACQGTKAPLLLY